MFTPKLKILSGLILAVALAAAGALLAPPPALGEDPPAPDEGRPPLLASAAAAPVPDKEAKPQRCCILLWMNGGPSQIDTFDPKPTDPNGALFPAIDTAIKDVQFAQTLPHLAKAANHLAVVRTVTHREGDHGRGTYLMRTGYGPDGVEDYPALGCVLAKELSDGRPDLPRYFSVTPRLLPAGGGYGPGLLGGPYAALTVEGRDPKTDGPPLPPVEAFEARAKGRGEVHRKAVEKAFDLTEEKPAVRDAYGRSHFGQSCLLARRLVERGVPVVEVALGGWDAHANAPALMPRLCGELDAAFAELLKDLHERKLLDTTLIVWMGEFGRTPRINNGVGRDHWPFGFSVVLAGAGIKGGQAIGKTSADGSRIEEKPVAPAELHATIYRALGLDPAKENRSPTGRQVPLAEKGAQPVREALR